MKRLAFVVLVLAALAAVWWVVQGPPPIPDVRAIQADALTYDELEAIVRQHPRIEKPASYAAFLYRRAYGKSPGAQANAA